MAKIYPTHLPQSVLSDPKRDAERKTYQVLSQLGSAFVVFYSVAWQARRNGSTRDGEADFVIAHPDLGILVIEVKGGGVAYDAASQHWTTTDRYGQVFDIDPVEQARKSHYTLLEKLRELPNWDATRFLTIGHAVCFPDVVVTQSLRLDLPRTIVIDFQDLDDVEGAVRRIFAHYAASGGHCTLGKDRLALVEGLLAHSFAIKTPLGVELAQEDERLIELTEQQMRILDFLRTRRRAIIAGCAGSGKTILAVEKARRLADQGFKVLLVCFNSALAEDLASRLPDVSVLHFHGLCETLVKEAGFTMRPARNEQEYFETVLPNMLLEAIDEVPVRFDAIIVDEGQDFKETYWLALAALLNEKESIFYIFYDDNQNLYGGAPSLAGIADEAPFSLSENCRNTQAIHGVVARFYSQRATVTCRGPKGRLPELRLYTDTAEMLRVLQTVLYRLITEEHILHTDIVILTPHGSDRSALTPKTRLGNFVLTADAPQRPQEIQATSVYKFKGLERRVVIITEVDSRFTFQPEIVMYVGCSRARTHLLFLVALTAPPEIKRQIEKVCQAHG